MTEKELRYWFAHKKLEAEERKLAEAQAANAARTQQMIQSPIGR